MAQANCSNVQSPRPCTGSGEILGAMLMTEHNLHFYQALMAGLRAAIAEGRLKAYADDFRAQYRSG